MGLGKVRAIDIDFQRFRALELSTGKVRVSEIPLGKPGGFQVGVRKVGPEGMDTPSSVEAP